MVGGVGADCGAGGASNARGRRWRAATSGAASSCSSRGSGESVLSLRSELISCGIGGSRSCMKDFSDANETNRHQSRGERHCAPAQIQLHPTSLNVVKVSPSPKNRHPRDPHKETIARGARALSSRLSVSETFDSRCQSLCQRCPRCQYPRIRGARVLASAVPVPAVPESLAAGSRSQRPLIRGARVLASAVPEFLAGSRDLALKVLHEDCWIFRGSAVPGRQLGC